MDRLSGAVVAGCLLVSACGVTLALVVHRLRSIGFLITLVGLVAAGWWFLSQWFGDWIGTDRVLYTVVIAGGGTVLGAALRLVSRRVMR